MPTTRAASGVALLVLAFGHSMGVRAQAPAVAPGVRASAPAVAATASAGDDEPGTTREKAKKSIFSEDGPVDTTWSAQLEALQRALPRLPIAAALSAVLAFRPRRRGTPKRQAPVIQTQIVLALVGAMVMLVVGASLARAFGIVGAAGLIRYRAKIDDPKDAGVMLSTLAIGLASGVGLYLFAMFATAFVLVVLVTIESIDPDPYLPFELVITADAALSLKESVEGLLHRRQIPYELLGMSADELRYEVKLPLEMHTDTLSQVLTRLHHTQSIQVKWEHMKDAKAS